MGLFISIEGPEGSGKTTVAKKVTEKLEEEGYKVLYTREPGGVEIAEKIRDIILDVKNTNLDPKSEKESDSLIGKISISFDEANHITLNDVDVSQRVRENDVANNVSYIASYKNIRLHLVDLQRKIAENKSVVMDGRDIGTYVLPNADLKIYQVATAEEKAKRRYKENLEKGIETTYEDCLKNINTRDYIDSHRSFCPLHPAEDSVEVNTTNMSIEEVVDTIINIAKERGIVSE